MNRVLEINLRNIDTLKQIVCESIAWIQSSLIFIAIHIVTRKVTLYR
ncbi:hypothetical protein Ga0466249_000521 [Sporomusaceae bacterium BoRhaA]|nr:hypothetical protein [Pelorhabdus rhamnosifermentans]